MYENVIELDIWSSYGCFNKSFSNKGGLLTYPIPPKTAVIGIIGAVLGIGYDEYEEFNDKKIYAIERLYDVQISIQPLFDLKTSRVIFNRCDKNISNINQDLLINPKFKLYLSFPDSLKNEEKEFLNKIKSNTTYYNLYMGRNEFPLNYNLKRIFKREDEKFNNNSDELMDVKLVGFIKRSLIKDISLARDINNESKSEDMNFMFNVDESKPFYEYLINDYPVKRTNFTDFSFEYMSFYPDYDKNKECYFEQIELKEDVELILTKIGDEKWICMI